MKNNTKKSLKYPNTAGVTLVEILVVLAIIGILMSILIPVIARAKIRAKAKMGRLDCSAIAQAITQYNMDNIGRFPIANTKTGKYLGRYDYNRYVDTSGVLGNDITLSIPDICFSVPGDARKSAKNSDAAIILSGLETQGTNAVNLDYVRNSKRYRYMDSKMAGDSEEKPGLGKHGVYRDPFGNPYVVTIDKSGDDKCWDVLYGHKAVSGTGPDHKYPTPTPSDDDPEIGAHGLMRDTLTLPSRGGAMVTITGYVLMGKAMVWSAGPDREVTPGKSGLKGCANKNADNIIGW